MKVCIIGASGKLGQYMVQHALDRGYAVVGVCRERSARWKALWCWRQCMEISTTSAKTW